MILACRHQSTSVWKKQVVLRVKAAWLEHFLQPAQREKAVVGELVSAIRSICWQTSRQITCNYCYHAIRNHTLTKVLPMSTVLSGCNMRWLYTSGCQWKVRARNYHIITTLAKTCNSASQSVSSSKMGKRKAKFCWRKKLPFDSVINKNFPFKFAFSVAI